MFSFFDSWQPCSLAFFNRPLPIITDFGHSFPCLCGTWTTSWSSRLRFYSQNRTLPFAAPGASYPPDICFSITKVWFLLRFVFGPGFWILLSLYFLRLLPWLCFSFQLLHLPRESGFWHGIDPCVDTGGSIHLESLPDRFLFLRQSGFSVEHIQPGI